MIAENKSHKSRNRKTQLPVNTDRGLAQWIMVTVVCLSMYSAVEVIVWTTCPMDYWKVNFTSQRQFHRKGFLESVDIVDFSEARRRRHADVITLVFSPPSSKRDNNANIESTLPSFAAKSCWIPGFIVGSFLLGGPLGNWTASWIIFATLLAGQN